MKAPHFARSLGRELLNALVPLEERPLMHSFHWEKSCHYTRFMVRELLATLVPWVRLA